MAEFYLLILIQPIKKAVIDYGTMLNHPENR